jgi:hypothetical protein
MVSGGEEEKHVVCLARVKQCNRATITKIAARTGCVILLSWSCITRCTSTANACTCE